MKIIAIVPMRHDSERVPAKNYRPFCGEPLYRYVIRTLLACPRISEVIIDTDSGVIMEDARAQFPTVRLVERPEALRAGTVPMNAVLRNTLKHCDGDLFVQTHSTNPLLGSATVERAIDALVQAGDAHDSLFSVTPLYARLWTPGGEPINHDPTVLLRTQDLAPVHQENSCLYLFTRESFERAESRIGARPLQLVIDRLEAWDIDEMVDFAVGEALYTAAVQRAG